MGRACGDDHERNPLETPPPATDAACLRSVLLLVCGPKWETQSNDEPAPIVGFPYVDQPVTYARDNVKPRRVLDDIDVASRVATKVTANGVLRAHAQFLVD